MPYNAKCKYVGCGLTKAFEQNPIKKPDFWAIGLITSALCRKLEPEAT